MHFGEERQIRRHLGIHMLGGLRHKEVGRRIVGVADLVALRAGSLVGPDEVVFDPQTSGGLLLAVLPEEANALEAELQAAGLPAKIVGHPAEVPGLLPKRWLHPLLHPAAVFPYQRLAQTHF